MSHHATYVGTTAAAWVDDRSSEGVLSSLDREDRAVEFKEFYIREQDSLYRFARSLVSDEQAAEDLVSEAMTVVFIRWNHLADGDEGRPKRFAYGIVRNLAYDVYRARKRYLLVGASESEEPLAEDPSDARIGMLDVERTIAQLPDKQSQVLRMEIEGFTTAEIARTMHVRESTARTHLAAARRYMRETLYKVFTGCNA